MLSTFTFDRQPLTQLSLTSGGRCRACGTFLDLLGLLRLFNRLGRRPGLGLGLGGLGRVRPTHKGRSLGRRLGRLGVRAILRRENALLLGIGRLGQRGRAGLAPPLRRRLGPDGGARFGLDAFALGRLVVAALQNTP